MKGLFIAPLLLAFFIGLVPPAHAADGCSSVGPACTVSSTGGGGACAQDQTDGHFYCKPNVLDQPVSASAAKTVTGSKESPDSAYGYVMTKIMSLFAWLLGVAIVALDYSVHYTVVTMSNFVKNVDAIGVAWRVMRDIGNIFLIFGFLIAGIATIINYNLIGWGRKMIPMLLVAAVFLNFSFFIASAVIDAGNLFATQFYTQIKGGSLPTEASLSGTTLLKQVEQEGISNKIMSQLGLTQLYNDARSQERAQKLLSQGGAWYVGFMGIILFLIMSFVMFALAFILIARFVYLIYLLIIAPIGFAGLAVPKLDAVAKKWWHDLFEQTITAPVLLLLLYIALAVITDEKFLIISGGNKPEWTGFFGGGANSLDGFANILVSFLVAMGLLLFVVIASKKMSAFGASWASKAAGTATFGLTAWGMRSTVGAGSYRLAQALRRTRFGGTKIGRAVIQQTLDRGTKGSFDLRGVKKFGGLKGLGVEAGDAQKGGYKAHRDEAIKSHQAYAKSISDAYDERMPNSEQRAKMAEMGARRKEAEKAVKDTEGEKTIVENKLKSVMDLQQSEYNRLKREIENTPPWERDPEKDRQLREIEQDLNANRAKLSEANDNLKNAIDALTKAQKEEENTFGESDLKNREEKGERQRQYASNIERSLPGWIMYGPGGTAAARKIIKDVKKSPADRAVDDLKKLLEKQESESKNEENKNEENKSETESKPEEKK